MSVLVPLQVHRDCHLHERTDQDMLLYCRTIRSICSRLHLAGDLAHISLFDVTHREPWVYEAGLLLKVLPPMQLGRALPAHEAGGLGKTSKRLKMHRHADKSSLQIVQLLCIQKHARAGKYAVYPTQAGCHLPDRFLFRGVTVKISMCEYIDKRREMPNHGRFYENPV